MSAKQFLVETGDDAYSLDPDDSSYGYEDQNKDEYAFDKAQEKKRGRPRYHLNKSPPSTTPYTPYSKKPW